MTDDPNLQPDSPSGREHEQLEALIGRWHTTGHTLLDPKVEIDATDTYEWLPGGLGLLHTVDARMGDERVQGGEIIGYDPAREAFVTQFVGDGGPTYYEASLSQESRGLVWMMNSDRTRFRGIFNPEGDTIDGFWELAGADGTWQRWMEITLAKA